MEEKYIHSVVVLKGVQMNPCSFSVDNGYKIERHIPAGEGDYHCIIVSDKNFRTEYFNIIEINYLPNLNEEAK